MAFPKLCQKVQKALVEAKKNAIPDRIACEGIGIIEGTYYGWLRKGRKDILENKKTPYSKLWRAIKKAKLEGTMELMGYIRHAANDPKHVSAAQWILERTNKKDFGVNSDVFEKIEKQVNKLEDSTQKRASCPDPLDGYEEEDEELLLNIIE